MINEINEGGVTAPLGFRASVALAKIKGESRVEPDVALLVSDEACTAAGLFTTNLVQAAPVKYDKKILEENNDKIYAVVVNSGNANACTGVHGDNVTAMVAESVAKAVGVKKNAVLMASTGVIGNSLPHDKIEAVIPELVENLDDDSGEEFAKAILTTDTFPKEYAVMVETETGIYTIGGTCKGAGMIAPSLATMLGFITTDAKISADMLHKALLDVADTSFNAVTVDGDMSTNDTLIALANGMSGVAIDDKNYEQFVEALEIVASELARMMAMDGEGATKLVTINVVNARTKADAKLCAFKIANSPLVKTMFAGCDPNWGRLMSSAGASGAVFNPDKVDIYFNDLHYVANGIIIDYKLEEDVNKIMQDSEYEITIDLNNGSESALFYTCDFTVDYVKINADYRS